MSSAFGGSSAAGGTTAASTTAGTPAAAAGGKEGEKKEDGAKKGFDLWGAIPGGGATPASGGAKDYESMDLSKFSSKVREIFGCCHRCFYV